MNHFLKSQTDQQRNASTTAATHKAFSLTAVLSMLAMPFALAVPAAVAASASSLNNTWAGYVAAYDGPYTQVEASWVQPAVTGTHLPSLSPDSTVIWVGIGGFGGPILGGPSIDDGNVSAPVQVGTTMDTNGDYGAWWATADLPNANAPGNRINEAVSPDDHLTAEVDYTGSSYHMWIMDHRANGEFWSRSYPGTINGNWPRNTAEVIVENPLQLAGNLQGKSALAPFSSRSRSRAGATSLRRRICRCRMCPPTTPTSLSPTTRKPSFH